MKIPFRIAIIMAAIFLFSFAESNFLSFGSALHAQIDEDRIFPINGGGGSVGDIRPKPNCNFQLVFLPSADIDACTNDLLTIDVQTVLVEQPGVGSFAYKWEVVTGNLQLVSQDDQSRAEFRVTGAADQNTYKCTVTRTGCTDSKNKSTHKRVKVGNVDSRAEVPSLSLDLGTCGGFPSQNPDWQIQLTATPQSNSYTTVWSGANVSFINPTNPADPTTADYGVQFEPNAAGPLDIYVTVTNRCGAAISTQASYNTNDCDPTIIFLRKGAASQEPSMTSKAILKGESFIVNENKLSDVSLRITNLLGQEVFRRNISGRFKLDSNSFERGIYFVQLREGDRLTSMTKLWIR